MRLNKYDFIALTEDWYSEANNQCQLQYHLAANPDWHENSWSDIQEVNSKGKLKMDELTKTNRKYLKTSIRKQYLCDVALKYRSFLTSTSSSTSFSNTSNTFSSSLPLDLKWFVENYKNINFGPPENPVHCKGDLHACLVDNCLNCLTDQLRRLKLKDIYPILYPEAESKLTWSANRKYYRAFQKHQNFKPSCQILK